MAAAAAFDAQNFTIANDNSGTTAIKDSAGLVAVDASDSSFQQTFKADCAPHCNDANALADVLPDAFVEDEELAGGVTTEAAAGGDGDDEDKVTMTTEAVADSDGCERCADERVSD